MERPDRTDEGIVDKIKVFSSDDEKLKVLSELLGNKTSRDIIRLLIKKEMYTNEIARKLELRRNLVSHHLQKMESIGLVEITNKKIVKKGEEHKFYKMSSFLFLAPDESKENLNQKGILKKIFTENVRLSLIGVFTLVSFFATNVTYKTGITITDTIMNENNLDVVIPLLVLIVGLTIEKIISYKK